MATYQVETPDGAKYRIEAASEDQLNSAVNDLVNPSGADKGFQLMSEDGGATDNQSKPNDSMANYWKQKGDYPEAGAEKPVEQRLAENAVAAGSGAMIPSGVASVAGLAKDALGGAGESTSTLAKYAGRFGENQMGKLHGTSEAQFKQLGQEGFGNSMRASYDLGDANLGLGSIGREQAVNERVAQIGSDLNDVRSQAAANGPNMTPQEMADSIQQAKGADYAPGGKHFGEEESFTKNLENIRQMPEGGIENFAQRASEINGNAAGSKMVLPAKSAAETDIAGQMSHINDANITKNLPGDVADHYGALKEQFGYAKNLQPMEMRGQAKEALRPTPNTAFGMVKSIAHSAVGGPKMGAQAGFGSEAALNGISRIVNLVKTNPASFGKFAPAMLQAYQGGGSEGVAATHYVLSLQHPDYNAMTQEQP
jgi:hypothetical protein